MTALAAMSIFFVLLAAICFHFGWRPGTDTFSRGRAQAGFVISLGFLAILASIAWVRAGSLDRLRAAGITPHPALDEPSGMAAGQQSGHAVWVFSTRTPGRELLGFYRDPAHVSGWQLEQDSPELLRFRLGSQRLLITGGEKRLLIYDIINTSDEAAERR